MGPVLARAGGGREVMLMYAMLCQLAGASLQRCRANDLQWRQRPRLTIGLGTAAVVFVSLFCTVACGGGDGSSARGGISMVVVSGQARIRSGEENTLVVEGREAVVAAGDQIVADEAGVKLLLADGSLLYLSPGADLQVATFSAEGTAKLTSQLKGRIGVEAASPLLTVETSVSVIDAFVLRTIQFAVIPTVKDTTFQLWIDDVNNAHLTVEAGEVNVANDDRTETIPAGSEVKAIPGGELIISQTGVPVGPPAGATATADLAPTITPDLSHPSPTAAATQTVAPNYLYPAPGLHGPGDGDDFKPSDDILLMWDTPVPLSQDEWYEVQLWKEGEPPKVVEWVKEGAWKVERKYYPGRYQWRIRVVRGQEGKKEGELSPPSQTWSFSWLSPSVPVSTVPTSPPVGGTPDLTIYLLGTNNAEGFAVLGGDEHVYAGAIYAEGGYVYGNVAVQIGDTVYHSDPKFATDPKPLPASYRLEVNFSDSLVAATDGKPGFDPQKAQFWVGELDCNSAAPQDKPYKIEMTLSAGGEIQRQAEVSFLVADAPLCGGGGEEPGEGGGGGGEPPVRP
jgi:hypothetical protein